MTANKLRQRRHILLTMLAAFAWRDAPAGPAPVVVAGLRTFLGGWLGIGRIVVGMARQGRPPNAPLTRGQMAVFLSLGLGLHFAP